MGYENYHPKFHDKCISATPLIDKNGRVYGVLSLEHPISPWWKYSMSLLSATNNIDFQIIKERKVEDKAFNLVNYYEVACDNIEQAIVITDKEGRITHTNKAAEVVLEKDRNVLNQCNVSELWPSDNPFVDSINEGKISTVAREIELEHGKIKMLIGKTIPVLDNDKKIKGSIGILKENKTTIKSATNNNLRARYTFDDIIGNSKAIREVVELAQAAAKLGSNVLIQGESGTGKELFAQAIHNHSENHDGPFVAVNCTAIPNSLLESELFGYDGGAFTGAKKEGSRGKFELAQGGSIFLDEINSMPMDMQVKILRTIQMKTVTRVGGTGVIPIDVRIIVATNEDLWELVKQGKFREDLYYRLNVISFTVPPLRDRREDIDLFVRTKMKNLIYTTKWATTISAGGMDILRNYDYPGNVRELENILERSTVLAAAKNAYVITEEDLCTYGGIKDHMRGLQNVNENEVTEAWGEKIDPFVNEMPAYRDRDKYLGSSIEEAEENAIRNALQLSEGNITIAAKTLGISRNTLYRKMKIYGLDNSKSR
jgi:transcriptional regulator with PAS, ATPase and Fis domain